MYLYFYIYIYIYMYSVESAEGMELDSGYVSELLINEVELQV